jgi:hypothetical protein
VPQSVCSVVHYLLSEARKEGVNSEVMRKFRQLGKTGSKLAYFCVRRQLEHCGGINRSSAAVTNIGQHFHFLSPGTRLFALLSDLALCVCSRPVRCECEANKYNGFPHSAEVI